MTMYHEGERRQLPLSVQEVPTKSIDEALADIAQAYVSLPRILPVKTGLNVEMGIRDDLFLDTSLSGTPEEQGVLSKLYAMAKVHAVFAAANIVAEPAQENRVTLIMVNSIDRTMLVQLGFDADMQDGRETASISFDPLDEELLARLDDEFSSRLSSFQS